MKPRCLSNLFKNTVTRKTSNHIQNVVSDSLTLKTNYVAKKSGNVDTLFKEIIIVPYEEVLPPLYLKNLLQVKPQSKDTSLSSFIDLFIKTLTGYIEEQWDPNKFNVVFHSSGWDSRILSAILSRIYKKHEDKFGKILFVCYGPECKALEEIMNAEGWKREQYVSLPWDDEYHVHNFNFKKAWLYLNGPCTYPVNNIFWTYKVLSSNGKIPQDTNKIQFWSAIYFNEVFAHMRKKSNPFKSFLNKYYYWWSTNLISGLPFNYAEPLLNHNTLKCIIEAKVNLSKEIRFKILREINPELCNIRKIMRERPQIPKKIRLKIDEDYSNSWYGKNVNPDVKRDMRLIHSSWWSAWSSASLIESLLEKGIKITCRS